MRRKAIAMLAVAVAGCSGEVSIQNTSSSGTGGSDTSSSSTSSSSSGTGGTGGSCSVSPPAGCGCPDAATGPWVRPFSVADSDKTTVPYWQTALPVAPDGSTVLRMQTDDSANDTSARLVKLDAGGNVVWELPEGRLWSPTPDPRDCSTVVTGTITAGSTDLLGQTISCSTAWCPFVARIDAAGSLESIKVYDFGGNAWTTPSIAGVLADGRIALVGPFEAGAIDLGNGPLSVPAGTYSGVFVALLSPAGDALWTRHFVKQLEGGYSWFMASAVVSPDGGIAVTTNPDGAVDFGDGLLPAPGAAAHSGVALASYDPTGALRFGKVIVAGHESSSPNLALDSKGNLILAQRNEGDADYSGGPLGADPTATVTAVAAFDADGQYLWSTSVDYEGWLSLAVDGADHVWAGAGSGAVAELDTTGALVATHALGGTGERHAATIGIAPDGTPMIAGTFNDTLDLGQGPIKAQSKSDAFVARLAP